MAIVNAYEEESYRKRSFVKRHPWLTTGAVAGATLLGAATIVGLYNKNEDQQKLQEYNDQQTEQVGRPLPNYLHGVKTAPSPFSLEQLLELQNFEMPGLRGYATVPTQIEEGSFLGIGPAEDSSESSETLDCTLKGDWHWDNSYLNCDSITMETDLAKGQKSLFERGVPQEVVTRNFKEIQDYLVNSGQLNEVIDNIYVENKDGERVWKKAGEDCGDGLNDVWDDTVFTFEFTPDIGSYMKNPTNTPQTAYDCESCDEPKEMTAVPEPEPVPVYEPIPEPEVEQPTREPITLRQANISCLEDHLKYNNQTNLEGINGVIGNEWVINIPVEQAFGYIDPTSADGTTIVYLDLKDNFTDEKGADGIVDSKMTIPNPYTSSERAAFTSIYNGIATKPTSIDRDQLEAQQENFKNAIERISSKADYCVFVEANNEPVEPIVHKEEPVERVVYEEVRPTTEVRRTHRHDHYCNHNVGHVRRGGFQFHASYSKTKVRGHGPMPHFRGGYQRRPIQPFLHFQGSIRRGGPSPSDNLNRRLNHYKGW